MPIKKFLSQQWGTIYKFEDWIIEFSIEFSILNVSDFFLDIKPCILVRRWFKFNFKNYFYFLKPINYIKALKIIQYWWAKEQKVVSIYLIWQQKFNILDTPFFYLKFRVFYFLFCLYSLSLYVIYFYIWANMKEHFT